MFHPTLNLKIRIPPPDDRLTLRNTDGTDVWFNLKGYMPMSHYHNNRNRITELPPGTYFERTVSGGLNVAKLRIKDKEMTVAYYSADEHDNVTLEILYVAGYPAHHIKIKIRCSASLDNTDNNNNNNDNDKIILMRISSLGVVNIDWLNSKNISIKRRTGTKDVDGFHLLDPDEHYIDIHAFFASIK